MRHQPKRQVALAPLSHTACLVRVSAQGRRVLSDGKPTGHLAATRRCQRPSPCKSRLIKPTEMLHSSLSHPGPSPARCRAWQGVGRSSSQANSHRCLLQRKGGCRFSSAPGFGSQGMASTKKIIQNPLGRNINCWAGPIVSERNTWNRVLPGYCSLGCITGVHRTAMLTPSAAPCVREAELGTACGFATESAVPTKASPGLLVSGQSRAQRKS